MASDESVWENDEDFLRRLKPDANYEMSEKTQHLEMVVNRNQAHIDALENKFEFGKERKLVLINERLSNRPIFVHLFEKENDVGEVMKQYDRNIAYNILQFCDVRTLGRVCQTSKWWREIATLDRIWKQHFRRFYREVQTYQEMLKTSREYFAQSPVNRGAYQIPPISKKEDFHRLQCVFDSVTTAQHDFWNVLRDFFGEFSLLVIDKRREKLFYRFKDIDPENIYLTNEIAEQKMLEKIPTEPEPWALNNDKCAFANFN